MSSKIKISSKKFVDANNNKNLDYESDSDESIDLNNYTESVNVGLLINDDDDDDDNQEMSESELQLERMQLRSPFFPSKVGGKPAWLDYNGLDELTLDCTSCKSPLTFLLQIYAPVNASNENIRLEQMENLDNMFHRTLFTFVCANGECKRRSFRAVRSQLPLKNEFYAAEAPPSVSSDDDAAAVESDLIAVRDHLASFYKRLHELKLFALCNVCGMPSGKRCAKCTICCYCKQEHQVVDWSKLGHKVLCSKYVESLTSGNFDELFRQYALDENQAKKKQQKSEESAMPFPEYEMSIEPEYLDDIKLEESTKKLKLDEKSKILLLINFNLK